MNDRRTLVDVLRERADRTPELTCFEFAGDGEAERVVSYQQLDRRAAEVAGVLREHGLTGQRALLLYPPGPDYVAAFFGCLYAGVVAVPVYLPTGRLGITRMLAVAGDAGTKVALSTAAVRAEYAAQPLVDSLDWLLTDEPAQAAARHRTARAVQPADLAFLQYTSGSTGSPKGVKVRHGNLMENLAVIGRVLQPDADTRAVSWLPPYHDMGLIGGILQPVYAGFPCTLLSPTGFLRKPLRWLEAISRHRATATAAPDFGYRECVRRIGEQERAGLDLSTLRHAMIGAEPVRGDTVEDFARAFAGTGFRRSSFHPCYGLAEATLFVTGGRSPAGPRVVEVGRRELEEGEAVLAADSDGGPTASFTGCGRPQGEDLVVVVDPENGGARLPGQVGEVCVSGPSVTGGYWGDTGTSSAFGVELPGHPGRSFLRTGDLGFELDGELFVTGRLKDLMVVRGRNHYAEDIERTASRSHPSLRLGRSAAFSVDVDGEERVVLVHEIAPRPTAEEAPRVLSAVREAVASEHGLALRDVVLVRSGAIDRTTSGKVRRDAMRRQWLDGKLAPVAAAPESEAGNRATHSALTRTVADALEAAPDRIRPTESLLGQGLDSLRAVRLIVELSRTYGVELTVDRLLDGLTPAQLETLVTRRDSAAPRVTGPPRRTTAPDTPKPSRAQEVMWLLDQMGAGSAYHVHGGVRLTGPVDPDLLGQCLNDLTLQYPVLRSAFVQDAESSLTTVVRPAGPTPLRRVDLTGTDGAERDSRFDQVVEELATAKFDLTTGPLLRAVLVQRDADDWYLGIAAHHIVVDGWSLGVLLRRLGERYAGRATGGTPPAPAAPTGPRTAPGPSWSDDDAAFWRKTLGSAVPLDFPLDAPPPQSPTWRGDSLRFGFSPQQAGRLRQYARSRQATLFMVLLTGLGAVLERWSGQDDFVVGTPAAGRDHETADEVGLFANVVPLRIDTSGAPAFGELLARVRTRCLAAYAHQSMPFDEIVRQVCQDRPDGRAPLVRAVLALNVPLAPWEAGGVRAEAFELPAPGAQFELALHLAEQPDGGLTGHVVYAADLLERDTVQRITRALTTLLSAATEGPGLPDDSPVTALPVMSAAERARVTDEFSGVRSTPAAPDMLHALVERQADLDPTAPAVIVGDRVLDYGGLEERANRLAWLLRDLGTGPDQPVAVCLPRSPELVIALLAVLKAGGAYLPLDTDYPHGRLAAQLRDAGPRVVLTDQDTASGLLARALDGAGQPAVVCLDADPHPAARFPATRPSATATPHGLAYVIHTSGTTGTPKGVMNHHAGVVNRLAWMQEAYGLTKAERVLHKTPVGFDVAVWEVFWPLVAGSPVVLARPDGHRDPAYLARLIREQGVTTCHFVPSMLRAFLDEPEAARCAGVLRRVICSGEELAPALAARARELLPDVELHNLYGPTEAAIDVTGCRIHPGLTARARLPIGRPLTGSRVYVLDGSGRPVPVGVAGELHIGGVQVARGYLGRPALTAERFVPDPFEPGGRLYRTGDRARWSADGMVEFLGRLDHQVKIRGHRIEPAEVEAALAAHPRVAAAVVDVRSGVAGEPRLVAYLVADGDGDGDGDGATDADRAGSGRPDDGSLRAFLAERLPPALVPAAFVVLPTLPTTPNGKLDRSALPEPAVPVDHTGLTPPRDPVEQRLADIWCDVLELPAVSVTHGFFELGGHSLLATRITARIKRDFGVELPVGELLSGSSSIADVAVAVQEAQWSQADPTELSRLLAGLENLSDSEVTDLLAQDGPDD
ncbi:amino acid adenylation domain-containing protein [Streptomyces sp. NPDC014684]|uniref:amino acid adenylation domain-containing protein n=1 Tax=Streptomyces sp. NPDC014684 TaxID=3364880 RepID=UPI0036FB1D53